MSKSATVLYYEQALGRQFTQSSLVSDATVIMADSADSDEQVRWESLKRTEARPWTTTRPKATTWSVWPAVAHMNEHVGQSIAYARMNGIVPPWSS